jgi:hypothetical protein
MHGIRIGDDGSTTTPSSCRGSAWAITERSEYVARRSTHRDGGGLLRVPRRNGDFDDPLPQRDGVDEKLGIEDEIVRVAEDRERQETDGTALGSYW